MLTGTCPLCGATELPLQYGRWIPLQHLRGSFTVPGLSYIATWGQEAAPAPAWVCMAHEHTQAVEDGGLMVELSWLDWHKRWADPEDPAASEYEIAIDLARRALLLQWVGPGRHFFDDEPAEEGTYDGALPEQRPRDPVLVHPIYGNTDMRLRRAGSPGIPWSDFQEMRAARLGKEQGAVLIEVATAGFTDLDTSAKRTRARELVSQGVLEEVGMAKRRPYMKDTNPIFAPTDLGVKLILEFAENPFAAVAHPALRRRVNRVAPGYLPEDYELESSPIQVLEQGGF